MTIEQLNIFQTYTEEWFSNTFGMPTAVQNEAWPAIAGGQDTLVSAPTGTGKTLSAFLVFIDRLKAQARAGTLKQELQLIYISPLKSLAGDIRENLKRPMEGISSEGELCGIDVAVRTGDTPQSQRNRMIKYPPHILITTPESLYLLITSKSGQGMLKTAKAIVLDELHALIDTKRGAHMMLSIARLDRICDQPLQRIGLSATIEPLDKAAEYLSPDRVVIAAPVIKKQVEIVVTSPWQEEVQGARKDPIWTDLAREVYKQCLKSRSVIAFVEGRRYAEKLAYYVNELGGEGFSRTHHGSLSKEQRMEVENSLRDGSLRLLCATSSMELGIDVGDIDQVLQVGCPKTISGTMQRLGRAGHNPGRVSVMHMYPRTVQESLYCGLTAKIASEGGVEQARPPQLCLDILAQHLVSMAAWGSYHVDEVMEILPRAYPFRDVTKKDVGDVLGMLAGDYEHGQDIPVRPRLLYDRINGRVEGDGYSRMLAISAGGTIPDKGLYTVKTEDGVKLGELDEEFVFESQLGDRFLLGTFTWQIVGRNQDTVTVRQIPFQAARLPFWKSELKGRALKTSLAFGSLMRRLGVACDEGTELLELDRLGLDEAASRQVSGFLKRQIEATGVLPDDKTIVIEHFRDHTGCCQLMVHAMLGKRVTAPLSILMHRAAVDRTGLSIGCVDEEDGFLLFPYGEEPLPEGLLHELPSCDARAILEAVLPSTSAFNITFRYNAGRALMMGVRKNGRQPLWMQRMRGAQMLDSLVRCKDHPLIRETRRECLEEIWDLDGVMEILDGIQSGSIVVHEMHLDVPSPLSLPFQWSLEAAVMYDYAPMTKNVMQSVEDSLQEDEMVKPAQEELMQISERKKLPEDARQLHSLLMMEGDLMAGELELPVQWLQTLAIQGQAVYIEPGLWIAAEHREEYEAALEQGSKDARMHILRRMLRYRGPHSVQMAAERYVWSEEETEEILAGLCQSSEAVKHEELYYHGKIYARARRETVKSLRREVKTLPPEYYAALRAERMFMTAPAGEQLKKALRDLGGRGFAASLWEGILLPGRVKDYREGLLDTLLAGGDMFWNMQTDGSLSFHRFDEIDWDVPLVEAGEGLSDKEAAVYGALKKRGASFMNSLMGVLEGESPHDTLLQLAGKGLVCADSFVPVRQWMGWEKTKNSSVRQRVNARVKALSAGRWDVVRPLLEAPIEQKLEQAFDRAVILCRETAIAENISWAAALEILRVWEYTGRARRGYFIQGLSGAQFIREKDFAGVMRSFEKTGTEILWLPAVDPAQVWGKILPHEEGREFINVSGTAVALRGGMAAAVFERQGKTLRIFEEGAAEAVLRGFVHDFKRKRLFPGLKRLIVKDYPEESASLLAAAGFLREMQDYVLYR